MDANRVEADERLDGASASEEELDRLSELLTATEQQLAEIPTLRLQIADLECEITRLHKVVDEAVGRAEQLELRLVSCQRMLAALLGSASWRITKPLRAAKRRLGT